MALHHPWVFVFGLLGNIISFVVYLAPVPTFIRVYKKKSTEGFQSIPYVCAIFSSMLWIYYAMVKTNAMLLITINSFGCVVETIYIAIYLKYADKEAKMSTIKMVVGLNLVGFSAILLVCHYLPTPALRVQVLGWICVGFATVVFAAPLSIMRLVIRTKSVEFMPFPLSLSLTISAVMWFMYGLLMKDMYIVFPNILGFTFGIAQMILYGIYRNRKLPAAPIHVEEIKEDIEMKLPAAPQQNDLTNCNDMIMKLDDINASSVRNAVASATVVHHEYRREDGKDDDDVTKTAEYHGDHDQLVHCPSQCRTVATDDHGIQIVPSTGGTTTTTVHLVDCAV